MKGAVEVYFQYGVPFFFRHVPQHAVPQYAGIVYQYVHTAEIIHSAFDNALSTLESRYAIRVGYGLATRLLDFSDNPYRRADAASRSVQRASHIVNHHLGAFFCHG